MITDQYSMTIASSNWWANEAKNVLLEYQSSNSKKKFKLLPKIKYLLSKASTEKRELDKLINSYGEV